MILKSRTEFAFVLEHAEIVVTDTYPKTHKMDSLSLGPKNLICIVQWVTAVPSWPYSPASEDKDICKWKGRGHSCSLPSFNSGISNCRGS